LAAPLAQSLGERQAAGVAQRLVPGSGQSLAPRLLRRARGAEVDTIIGGTVVTYSDRTAHGFEFRRVIVIRKLLISRRRHHLM